MNKWVGARLTGGLGNRLFQLAAAHKLSEDWRIGLIFAMPYCLPSEHGDYETIFKMFPSIQRVWKAEPLLAIKQDECFKYNPFPRLPPADRILLRGFWQAANYVSESFKPSWDCIDSEPILQRWNLTTVLQRQKTAFLHIRLGDYTILPHHQVNLLSYYIKAMDSFPDDTRFLLFSDEPAKAKTFSIFNDRCVFVEEPSELLSMYLMSQCHAGAITANSTFSWWGAFFAAAAVKEIDKNAIYLACMPTRWMVSNEVTDDIYPNWVKRIDI